MNEFDFAFVTRLQHDPVFAGADTLHGKVRRVQLSSKFRNPRKTHAERRSESFGCVLRDQLQRLAVSSFYLAVDSVLGEAVDDPRSRNPASLAREGRAPV